MPLAPDVTTIVNAPAMAPSRMPEGAIVPFAAATELANDPTGDGGQKGGSPRLKTPGTVTGGCGDPGVAGVTAAGVAALTNEPTLDGGQNGGIRRFSRTGRGGRGAGWPGPTAPPPPAAALNATMIATQAFDEPSVHVAVTAVVALTFFQAPSPASWFTPSGSLNSSVQPPGAVIETLLPESCVTSAKTVESGCASAFDVTLGEALVPVAVAGPDPESVAPELRNPENSIAEAL